MRQKYDYKTRSNGPDPIVQFLVRKTELVGVTEVLTRTGFSDATLRAWRRGRTVPTIDRLSRWANALGYEVGLVQREQTGTQETQKAP